MSTFAELSERADAAHKRDLLAASQKLETPAQPVKPVVASPQSVVPSTRPEPFTEAEAIEFVKNCAEDIIDAIHLWTFEEIVDELLRIDASRPGDTVISFQEIVTRYAPNARRTSVPAAVAAETPAPANSKPALPAMSLAEQKAWFEEHYEAGQPSWIFQHTTNPGQLDSEPPKWLIEGMIYKTGLHLFSGREGSTKSLLHLMLTGALCRGCDFMGRKNGEGSISVVYVDKENPQSEVRLRCAKLGLLDLENFRIWGDWNVDNPPPATFDDDHLRECARRERPFFIFDSLSSFLDGANEIDAGQMTLVLGKARSLARMCAGVSIIHHQGVDTGRSRGSSAIAAASDMAFLLKKETYQGKDRITLTDERFRPIGPYRMVWDMDYGDRYTAIVVENGLTGDRAIVPPKVEPKPKKDPAGDAELIERARVEIEKAYAAGKTVTQGQLATLVGISSSKVKSRVLSGSPDRPWGCVPGPMNSTFFLPKGVTEIPATPKQG